MGGDGPHDTDGARDALERALRDRIRRDEAAFSTGGDGPGDRPADTLWDHVRRVARLAVSLGREEGVDPEACRLAGLFHDAGKFAGGRYHDDDLPEEQRSVRALRELAADHGLPAARVEPVAEAILQLYRDDPEPTPLARVLFDADNLDKLGPLGVANFFAKAGLRGRAMSLDLLRATTVELTYARSAPDALYTAAGRRRAAVRGAQTEAYFAGLFEALRDDGLADIVVEEAVHEGLPLVIATPRACSCGGALAREIREVPGMKCVRIHLRHRCTACGAEHELAFCRPRLGGGGA